MNVLSLFVTVYSQVSNQYNVFLSGQDDDFNEKLSEGQKHFRAVFLRLIADKKQRREYLKTQLKVDYGVEFEDRMKDLLRRVIDAIDRSLPPCAIDRVCQQFYSTLN